MEDILDKVRGVEEKAKNIISNSESEASGLIEEANTKNEKKFETEKKSFFMEKIKNKEEQLIQANIDKDKKINEEIRSFKHKLGDIDNKKEISEQYLVKSVKTILGL